MKYILFFCVLMATFSCAQKVLVPVENGVKVDPKTLTATHESTEVKIKVRTNAWECCPSYLDDYVLPIYIEVKNRSPNPIELSLKDVVLVDDKGNQYNALEPKEVAEAVRGGSGVGVSLGFAYGTPGWGLGWVAGGPAYYDSAEDVINKAFIAGRILPGAKLKGFVYFQKIPDEVRRITMRIGYRIGERRKEVVFKFRVRKGSSDNGHKEDRSGGSEGSAD